jgi:hypothetical protein
LWTDGAKAAKIRIGLDGLLLPLGGSAKIAEHKKHRGEEEAFHGGPISGTQDRFRGQEDANEFLTVLPGHLSHKPAVER